MKLDNYIVAIVLAFVIGLVLHSQANAMPVEQADKARDYRNYAGMFYLFGIAIVLYRYVFSSKKMKAHMCGLVH